MKSDEFISEAIAQKIIVDAGVEGMYIRSAFTCKLFMVYVKNVMDVTWPTGKDVEVGEAVCIMAAQSIGEPGIQSTMRTFHTVGLQMRMVEISHRVFLVSKMFEARCPKGVAVLAQISGEITSIEQVETGI